MAPATGQSGWKVDDEETWHGRYTLMDALIEEIERGTPISKLYASYLARAVLKNLSPFHQTKYGRKLAALKVPASRP
jgi:hypothetical protein